MAQTFRPGDVEYEGAMARDFDAARGLSPDSVRVWRNALRPHLEHAAHVLDVGAGTGRFAVLVAEWFGGTVIGVEPAPAMLEAARVTGRHPEVRYVRGRAEQLPLRSAAFDAAVVSNVYHHVVARRACTVELHRVLRSHGRVVMRGAFAGRLDGITLFAHFPEARVVCEQFPTVEEVVRDFAGFVVEELRGVSQQTCVGLRDFAARTRLRADTTLALIPDDVFLRRQAALETAAAEEHDPAPVVDTLDLLVLRKLD